MLLGVISMIAVAPPLVPAVAAPDDLGLAAGHGLLDQVEDDAGPIPDNQPRWEAGFGPELGVSRVGGHRDAIGAFRGEGGVRWDPLAFYGTCDLLFRFGVEARLNLERGKLATGRRRRIAPHLIRKDIWIEAGVGRERLGPDTAQSWRNDIGFGVVEALTERGDSFHRTLEFDIRVTLARAPRSEMTALDSSVVVGVRALYGN